MVSNGLDSWAKTCAKNTNHSRKNILIKNAFDIQMLKHRFWAFIFNYLGEKSILSFTLYPDSEPKAQIILYLDIDAHFPPPNKSRNVLT